MVAKAWDENPEDLDIIDGKVISYKSEESIPLEEHRHLRHPPAE